MNRKPVIKHPPINTKQMEEEQIFELIPLVLSKTHEEEEALFAQPTALK